jgi:hypothetical protein
MPSKQQIRKAQQTARDGKHVVTASRGSVVWGVNLLRSDALSRLLDDLVDLQETGLRREDCQKVVIALEKLANHTSTVPDYTWWRRTIHGEVVKFKETYEKWNYNEGMDNEAVYRRKMALKDLRTRRNLLSTTIRKNQYILEKELDLALVESMYSALRDLNLALPSLFKNVGMAVARYDSRNGVE